MKQTFTTSQNKPSSQLFKMHDQNVKIAEKHHKIAKVKNFASKPRSTTLEVPIGQKLPMTNTNTSFPQTKTFKGVDFESILNHLRANKTKNQCPCDPITKQTEVTRTMRVTLFNWLLEVATKLKLKNRTVYLCANIFDRYLSKISIDKKNLQLVGVTCLYIASKFEDIHPPKAKDLCYLCNNIYTEAQIFELEAIVLSTINFDLIFVSALDLAEIYLAKMTSDNEHARSKILAVLNVFLVQGTISMVDSFKLANFACTLVQDSGCLSQKLEDNSITTIEVAKLKQCFTQMVSYTKKHGLGALEQSISSLPYELLSVDLQTN